MLVLRRCRRGENRAQVAAVEGLVVAGAFLDHHSYATVFAPIALSQLVVAALVMRRLPESAHRELEDLNPEDRVLGPLT